jgi:hypothetical protein
MEHDISPVVLYGSGSQVVPVEATEYEATEEPIVDREGVMKDEGTRNLNRLNEKSGQS